ncbi:MAG: hypothetical protein CFK49_07005 [Armatimonadetes bacterium JP3_11]|nr:MAG: hypothetical protein CFK48_05510 [Armatimonadetes bacterium CP1_7O]OYT74719.1 MAG: hypothetical protein CFK49_07005 [Armatimonadetes bacterium JP3_11]
MTDLRMDFAEPRLLYDRLAVIATGKEWDAARSQDVWVDPVTYTLMLRPLPLTPEWQTSASSPYNRLRLSDTNRASDSNFREYQRGFSGNYWIHAAGLPDDDANARAIQTTATYPKNQAWYVAAHFYAYTAEQRVALECNWLQGTQAGVGLRFWSDGRVDVYRGQDYLGSVDLRSNTPQQSSTPVQSLQNQDFYALLIPCRRRSLLILTSIGCAEYVFDDLDPDASSPEITPQGAFRLYVPTGTITLQFAPLKYRTSGYALSTVREFRYAPSTGRTVDTTVYYDMQGRTGLSVSGSLRKVDNSADFTPDGNLKQGRIRVQLTGDGSWTPFAYGAASVIAPEFASTPNAPVSLINRTRTLAISIGAEPEDAVMEAECQWLASDALQDNRGVEFVWTHPLYAVDVPLFRGRAYPPDLIPAEGSFEARFRLAAKDLWRVLADAILFDPTPLDGLEVGQAIRQLCHQAGLPDSLLDLGDTGVLLPTTAAQGGGEWAVYPKVGDSAGEWVRRLWQSYAWDWFLGFKPTPSGWKLVFRPYDDTTRVDVYLTSQEAQVAQGAAWLWHTVQDLRHDLIEPEANEVIVTGWDPNARRPIQAIYRDYASMDSTLAPASRPNNWIGAPRRYGWVDYTITRLADAERVRDYLANKLTVRRYLAEWTSLLLTYVQGGVRLPVWRGDVVGIVEGNIRHKYRVLSLDIEVFGTPKQGELILAARYRAEKIAEETIT